MKNSAKNKKYELMVYSQMAGRYQPHGAAPLFDKQEECNEYARKHIKYGSKWRSQPCYYRTAPQREEWMLIQKKK